MSDPRRTDITENPIVIAYPKSNDGVLDGSSGTGECIKTTVRIVGNDSPPPTSIVTSIVVNGGTSTPVPTPLTPEQTASIITKATPLKESQPLVITTANSNWQANSKGTCFNTDWWTSRITGWIDTTCYAYWPSAIIDGYNDGDYRYRSQTEGYNDAKLRYEGANVCQPMFRFLTPTVLSAVTYIADYRQHSPVRVDYYDRMTDKIVQFDLTFNSADVEYIARVPDFNSNYSTLLWNSYNDNRLPPANFDIIDWAATDITKIRLTFREVRLLPFLNNQFYVHYVHNGARYKFSYDALVDGNITICTEVGGQYNPELDTSRPGAQVIDYLLSMPPGSKINVGGGIASTRWFRPLFSNQDYIALDWTIEMNREKIVGTDLSIYNDPLRVDNDGIYLYANMPGLVNPNGIITTEIFVE